MYFQWKRSGPILYHYSDLCLHSAGVALFLGRTKYSRACIKGAGPPEVQAPPLTPTLN